MRVILKASPNAVQIENWNNASGRTWAQYQEALDRQIEPLGAQAIRVLAPRAGERILDIGCGCGHTTVELAQRVRPGGLVLGVDVSVPMLEVARRRPLPQADFQVAFQQADAQCDALGEAAFDAAYSRFGVMFFSDPVAAFANIRLALKTGGRLSFVCWRPLEQNEWMKVPLEAALPFLPSAQMPAPASMWRGPTSRTWARPDPLHLPSALASAMFLPRPDSIRCRLRPTTPQSAEISSRR